MSKWVQTGISGIALMIFAGPGLGDVSPEDVWQNWQDWSAAMDQTLTTDSVAREGDTLVVRGLKITSTQPEASASSTLGELRFTDAGGGTVDVVLPPDYPLTMSIAERPDHGPIDISMNIIHDDLTMTASGDPDKVSYDFAAPNLTVKLNQINGVSANAINLTGEMTLANTKGSYIAGQDGSLVSDFTIGTMAMAMVGSGDDTEIRIIGSVQDIAGSSAGKMLGAMSGDNFAAAIAAGATSRSSFSFGSSDFDVEAVGAQGPVSIKGTAKGAELTGNIDAAGLDYTIRQDGLALTMNNPSVPIPNMSLGFDEIGFGLKSPVAQDAAAQPFGLNLRLINMTLSDQIWALFDPMSALPRDPVNLIIDTEGMAKITGKYVGGMTPPNQFPAEIESLNLKELKLSVAGAELTGAGTGAVDYPENTAPIVSADMNFKLLGANALLDRLVAAGLLQAEQLMVPRMMLAMIATPDPAGGDALTSNIVVKDGGLFANGQKLYDLPMP